MPQAPALPRSGGSALFQPSLSTVRRMRGPGAHIQAAEGQRRPGPVHGGGRDGGRPVDRSASPGVGRHVPDEAGGRTAQGRSGRGGLRAAVGPDVGDVPGRRSGCRRRRRRRRRPGKQYGGRSRDLSSRAGQARLSGLTARQVQAFYAELRARGLSSRSRQVIGKVLRMALADAVKRGYVARNVAAAVELPSGARRARSGVVPDRGGRVPGSDRRRPAVPRVGVGPGDRAAAGRAVRACAGWTSIWARPGLWSARRIGLTATWRPSADRRAEVVDPHDRHRRGHRGHAGGVAGRQAGSGEFVGCRPRWCSLGSTAR